MQSPVLNVLLKVFANGFYRVHGGILAFLFYIMFGMVPANTLLNYHKNLMLAFISAPIMMIGVFVIWLLYVLKSTHFIAGQIALSSSQFLSYSSTALSYKKQFNCWFIVQIVVSLPFVIYALISAGVAVAYHFYLSAIIIILYVILLMAIGAVFYLKTVNQPINNNSQSALLKITGKWQKPLFSLFIYYVFDVMKFRYMIIKVLSWLIITGVFYLFADVQHDIRVAGIAVLSIICAHTVLIFEDHKFEDTYLAFARNLPYTRGKLFTNKAALYVLLLLPEIVWVFGRFNLLTSIELLLFALSTVLLFHSLLYWLGLDMEKYLQWIFGLFMATFVIILYRLFWLLIPLNLVIAFALFYRNYYKYQPII